MKQVYETPEAKLICFQALESIALLEHEVSPASDNESVQQPGSMGVIVGGRD